MRKPPWRVHIFYYPHDSYGGPGWTWCPELNGEVRDYAVDLSYFNTWDEARERAFRWLHMIYTKHPEVARVWIRPTAPAA